MAQRAWQPWDQDLHIDVETKRHRAMAPTSGDRRAWHCLCAPAEGRFDRQSVSPRLRRPGPRSKNEWSRRGDRLRSREIRPRARLLATAGQDKFYKVSSQYGRLSGRWVPSHREAEESASRQPLILSLRLASGKIRRGRVRKMARRERRWKRRTQVRRFDCER